MTYASVPDSAAIEVYASWALIMVRMIYASVGADPLDKHDTSCRSRTRIYPFEFVVHKSIAKEKVERNFMAAKNPVRQILRNSSGHVTGKLNDFKGNAGTPGTFVVSLL